MIGTAFRGMGMEPEYQSPELRYLFNLYKERYRIEPTLFSITGWERIRDALENIRGFQGAMDEVNMSPTDHCGRSIKDIG